MANKDIIVIGASLGGIEALKSLAGTLPQDLNAAIFVVLHIAASSPGVLPSILRRSGPLPASNAQDGESIKKGHIFVAPADHHLLVDRSGRVRVTRGPKENLCRPAVDPLFRSAASAFGKRVVGVVLTGGLDDGTAGLSAVKQQGGTAIVQHPNDAVAPSMPLNAMLSVSVDHCVPLPELGPLLVRLTNETVDEKEVLTVTDQMQTEIKIASGESTAEALKLGKPSPFACPECHGVLSEIREARSFRFRCHTGHAYSLQTLLSQLGTDTEESIWNALRALEEKMILLRKAAAELELRDKAASAECVKEAAELEQTGKLLRKIALGGAA